MNFGEIIRKDGQILLEMANIGSFDGFTIYIYGSEGPKPHFHLIKGNPKYPDFETCIKINNPIYFHHSGKEGVLNSKEKKRLIEFLKSNNKYFPDKTNWQMLVIQWSMNNTDFQISPKTKIPNYIKL
jgi:hypothetical protein